MAIFLAYVAVYGFVGACILVAETILFYGNVHFFPGIRTMFFDPFFWWTFAFVVSLNLMYNSVRDY